MESQATDVVYVCPECGGRSVDYGTLYGASAACRSCGWHGQHKDLLALSTGVDGATLFNAMLGDFKGAFSATAVELGRVLVKYGFVEVTKVDGVNTINSKQLVRYLSAAARTTLQAVIAERTAIQQEREHGRATAS